jgi:peptidoglycan/xylan/chitin deacetylase (PgdA/CDA1 family)
MPHIPLIVSLDTEEDNWHRSRTDVTVTNIGELRRQARLFERLGVRPTYFTTYHVAIDPGSAEVMREVGHESRGEIAAHLHPWNTPPLTEAFVPRNSMVKNLPRALQLAKIQTLTAALQQAFGRRPTSFRAGRYGIGPDTVAALVSCGYRVDSSVSPFVNLETVDDGPSFVGAPIVPYRLEPDCDVRRPASDGPIVEIPLSYGFSRGPFSVFNRVQRLLEAAPRGLHLPGIAVHTGLVRRLSLSPEFQSVAQMLKLSARLLEHGARHLHISWHTPSLMPGLSPFTRTAADVERLYGAIEAYLDRLASLTTFRCVTVSEAAAALVEVAAC